MSARTMGDRLIVAVDVPDKRSAISMFGQLEGVVQWVKIGSQLFTAVGPEAVGIARAYGFRAFLDLKLHDTPETVAGAVASATRHGVAMISVHCDGGYEMLVAAHEAANKCSYEHGFPRPLIVGITVPTSKEFSDFERVGLLSVNSDAPARVRAELLEELVGKYAKLAQGAGLDGVVASPLEANIIRRERSPGFIIVTPGIRSAGFAAGLHKRVGTPVEALLFGANYLVVGRPITRTANPARAVKELLDEMATVNSGGAGCM